MRIYMALKFANTALPYAQSFCPFANSRTWPPHSCPMSHSKMVRPRLSRRHCCNVGDAVWCDHYHDNWLQTGDHFQDNQGWSRCDGNVCWPSYGRLVCLAVETGDTLFSTWLHKSILCYYVIRQCSQRLCFHIMCPFTTLHFTSLAWELWIAAQNYIL